MKIWKTINLFSSFESLGVEPHFAAVVETTLFGRSQPD